MNQKQFAFYECVIIKYIDTFKKYNILNNLLLHTYILYTYMYNGI